MGMGKGDFLVGFPFLRGRSAESVASEKFERGGKNFFLAADKKLRASSKKVVEASKSDFRLMKFIVASFWLFVTFVKGWSTARMIQVLWTSSPTISVVLRYRASGAIVSTSSGISTLA